MVFIIFMLCISVAFADTVPTGIESRIYKGKRANIRRFPYFAGLHNCGASIISSEWLITAAHCVDDELSEGSKLVYIGGERQDNSMIIRYKKAVIHPEYSFDAKKLINDIALLKLGEPLTFSKKIRPVKLLTGDIETIGGRYIAIGRGSDHTGGESTSLMKLEVERLSAEICSSLASSSKKEIILKNEIICIRRKDRRAPSICEGDSGSPLIVNNVLVGIVSFAYSRNCSDINYYANVAPYATWIKKVTGLKF